MWRARELAGLKEGYVTNMTIELLDGAGVVANTMICSRWSGRFGWRRRIYVAADVSSP